MLSIYGKSFHLSLKLSKVDFYMLNKISDICNYFAIDKTDHTKNEKRDYENQFWPIVRDLNGSNGSSDIEHQRDNP